VPCLLIESVCASIDAQTFESKSLLDSAQQAWAIHVA